MSPNKLLKSCSLPAIPFLGVIVISLILMTAACSKKEVQPSSQPQVRQETGRYAGAGEIEKRILAEYRQWRGTRHKLGGSGSEGIDCSGFVKAVYREAFDIDLPRTTKAQVKLGKSLVPRDLQAGDLVFFKPPTYPRHVGIYLSRSEFVHASKSKGVIISSIDDPYWRTYYWTARRILPDR